MQNAHSESEFSTTGARPSRPALHKLCAIAPPGPVWRVKIDIRILNRNINNVTGRTFFIKCMPRSVPKLRDHGAFFARRFVYFFRTLFKLAQTCRPKVRHREWLWPRITYNKMYSAETQRSAACMRFPCRRAIKTTRLGAQTLKNCIPARIWQYSRALRAF